MADSTLVFPPGWRASEPTGKPISGAKIEFYIATSTPDPSYSDAGLSVTLPNPVICDSGGQPTSDGNTPVLIWRGTSPYRMRLLRADDTVVWDFDNITGALPFSSVAAAVATWNVGDVKPHLGLTPPSTHWLALNGSSIGSASSGATARASDSTDTLALFTLLWNADTGDQLAITDSAGTPSTKGSTAGADFLANKRLRLPDWRDVGIAFAGNMGGTVSRNLLTDLSGGINGDVPFATGGAELVTLTEAQLPVIDPDDKMTDPTHRHQADYPTGPGAAGDGIITPGNTPTARDTTLVATGITFAPIGSGDAHNNIQPTTICPMALVYAGVP